ncbi:MAG: hypothetical protein IPG76_21905 [Acidobacteria bacterium]|nr:hypothetical protein [Acidobacteriota bacterium]
MAFFFLNDSKTAIEEARAAIKVAPESLQAHYIMEPRCETRSRTTKP